MSVFGNSPATPFSGAIAWLWYKNPGLVAAATVLIAASAAMLVLAPPAWGMFVFEEAVKLMYPTLDELMQGMFGFSPQEVATQGTAMVGNFLVGTQTPENTTSLLKKDFSLLTGGAYATITGVAQNVLNLAGYPILAILTVVQIAKIGSKMDGNATLPAFKDIIFVFVYYAVFYTLITNSTYICGGIYEVVLNIIKSISSPGTASVNVYSEIADNWDQYVTENGVMTLLILALISFIAAFIGNIISFVVVFARAIQIYAYTAFAPIPLALLGAEVTRSYGTGFLKNYLAVCLAGVLIVVIMIMGPYIMNAGAAFGIPGALAAVVVYIMALTQSGGWAKEIIGG